jgi:proline dehydrogenase
LSRQAHLAGGPRRQDRHRRREEHVQTHPRADRPSPAVAGAADARPRVVVQGSRAPDAGEPHLPGGRGASRRYVAGETLADAQRVAAALARQGHHLTLCLWPWQAPPRARSPTATSRPSPPGLPPPPRRRLAPERQDARSGLLRGVVAEVARRAAQAGVRLHFDSHGPETADPTFALVPPVLAAGCDLGVTLPGAGGAAWRTPRPPPPRACGSAWSRASGRTPGPPPRRVPRPAGGGGRARRQGPARGGRQPRRGRGRAGAGAPAERARTPCELQLLYGLPPGPAPEVARRFGVPVRYYVGYGRAGCRTAPCSSSRTRRSDGACCTTPSRPDLAHPAKE